MKSFYFTRIERRDFGDLLTVEGVGRFTILDCANINHLPTPFANGLIAVWEEDPRHHHQLPSVLVCADEMEADIAAWITTFAAKIRPFSAYMRLLTVRDLLKLRMQSKPPSLGNFLLPITGMILGEVLAVSRRPDRSLDAMPANVFTSTLSFALFRAVAAYQQFDRLDELLDRWESVRRITKQRTRLVDARNVVRVCLSVMGAGRISGIERSLSPLEMQMAEACNVIVERRGSVPEMFFGHPLFADAAHMMRGQREDRVVALNLFLKHSGKLSGQESQFLPFMLGYLTSRIAPGTMRHFSLLEAIMDQHPTSALWYGFFAGVGESDSASVRRNIDLPGSAKRVARELLQSEDIFNPPSSDIGFNELIVLSRTNSEPFEGLVTITQGTAIVELIPLVRISVNVSARPSVENAPRSSREREIVASMGREIERLSELYKSLSVQEGATPEQISLFPSKRKRK